MATADLSRIPAKGFTNYVPAFRVFENLAQLRVLGPRRWDGSLGYWAGQYTADELERLGVEAIQFAARMRASQ